MGGGSDASSQMRKDEQARQNRINQGMGQINAIFGGGAYGVNPAAAYTPGSHYFTGAGKPYAFDINDPATIKWAKGQGIQLGPKGGRPQFGPMLSMDQLTQRYGQHLAKTGGLFGGTETFQGFTPDFYAQRTKDYENYALPQLQQQYSQQQNQAAFGLANRGLINSSAAAKERGTLAQQYNVGLGNIANQGIGQAQDLRSRVEQNRAQLVGQLQASGDPQSTAQLALSSTSQFSAPSAFAPVGNLFQNFAQTYGAYNQAQQYAPLFRAYQQQGYGDTPGAQLGASYSIRR